ncbi:cellulose synthase (UDP-forming) [Cupriavidus gilardii J11]|uniref:Cellulose synthase catalytic subunit [UDP-forming] n=1 Tax=Cupriavidus gilardii J11 TaxID=936133 RepID=A0A562BN84_9BURK|nr:UDP-forming cellulose synthase catalytic subunit [Cupriavidus gilardii]TWG86738.1 cellulose synthase (UDP-forming) [Cupriavidus gilardii J11]
MSRLLNTRIERARRALAARLGLPASAGLLLWLVRLFFRPVREGARDWPALAAAWLAQGAAERLDLAGRQGVGIRLWRLFVRPARPRRPLAAPTRRRPAPVQAQSSPLRQWLDRTLEPVWRFANRQRRRMAARLPRIDWHGAGHRFARIAALLNRVRGLTPLMLLGAAVAGLLMFTTPLPIGGQLTVFAVVWVAVMLLRKVPGRFPTLMMMALSLLMTLRYIWWRATETLDLMTPLEIVIGYLLFAAEGYTWLVLILGYLQTAWPLARRPKPLPADPAQWPTVDVFIPTYNEPLSVVQPTIHAARSMDWPADKINIYVLDDGRRPAFREFCEQVGVHYLTREDNRHAKAGNINSALGKSGGDYIAIFDCDHIPTRSFLQMTMGEFIADPQCAMVQTPHHFFSPDPFERNFDTFRRVPNEGSLFYGLIQDGNDLWNATFFCGSCAVIKRAPLLEIGGIAVETVTEDAHTALKLHRRGYNTAYLRTVQAAGLATESLSSHIGQRIRWARGMAQIFRIDNPLFGKGLKLFQRICYSNAMLHFFYGIPRLIFLTMPLAYLVFGLHVINTSAALIAAYVLPYLVIANITNSRIQGKYRHSFWAEVYESVLAWYIVLPTTLAFIDPKLGKFNVTAKGGRIEDDYLDWTITRPYLVLLALNVVGLAIGVGRLVFWSTGEPGTVVMNMVWASVNLLMLGAAIGVAREARQIRISHRIPMRVPATLLLPDGTTVACRTENYSLGGLGLLLPVDLSLTEGQRIGVCLSRGAREYHFAATVTRNVNRHVGVRMDDLSIEAETQLIQCTFGRADAWVDWVDDQPEDVPLRGLKEVIEMGYQGYLRLYDALMDAVEDLLRRRRPRRS